MLYVPTPKKINIGGSGHFNPIQYADLGGGGEFCLHGLWTFTTFLISKLKPPNLVTFAKIYQGTIWCSKSLSIKFDVTMTTAFS